MDNKGVERVPTNNPEPVREDIRLSKQIEELTPERIRDILISEKGAEAVQNLVSAVQWAGSSSEILQSDMTYNASFDLSSMRFETHVRELKELCENVVSAYYRLTTLLELPENLED